VPVRVAGTKNEEVTLTPAIDQYRTVPLETLVVVTVVVITSFCAAAAGAVDTEYVGVREP
jgi:hypothetical protein